MKGNTFLKLPTWRLFTWKSPVDTPDKPVKNQIDYVNTEDRYRNSINQCKFNMKQISRQTTMFWQTKESTNTWFRKVIVGSKFWVSNLLCFHWEKSKFLLPRHLVQGNHKVLDPIILLAIWQDRLLSFLIEIEFKYWRNANEKCGGTP